MKSALLIGSALFVSALPSAASAEPVLLIAIDGLQPADILKSEERGIQVPNLKQFITNGTYAAKVKGVLPTVTYPSHATLLTGVSPAKHGNVGNNSFDPMQINQGGWYWYATDFKVPTCGMPLQRPVCAQQIFTGQSAFRQKPLHGTSRKYGGRAWR